MDTAAIIVWVTVLGIAFRLLGRRRIKIPPGNNLEKCSACIHYFFSRVVLNMSIPKPSSPGGFEAEQTQEGFSSAVASAARSLAMH
jgi:hypothetical protein